MTVTAIPADADLDGVFTPDDCDDGDASLGVSVTYFLDADGDGYGLGTSSLSACSQPSSYVSNGTDCDDSNASINPAAQEMCGDGIDNNCDGVTDGSDCYTAPVDVDRDGYDTSVDCDDTRASVNPGATDDCTNQVDMNCDGLVTGCSAAVSATDPNIEINGEPEGVEDTSGGSGGGGGCSLNAGVPADAGLLFFLFGVVFFRFLVKRV